MAVESDLELVMITHSLFSNKDGGGGGRWDVKGNNNSNSNGRF